MPSPRRSPTASSAAASTASPAAWSTSGVQPGQVVSVQLPNDWVFAALILACARVGAVVNPLVPIFRHRELRFMLGRTEAPVVRRARHVPGLRPRRHARRAGRRAAHARAPLRARRARRGPDLPPASRSFEAHFLDRRWEDDVRPRPSSDRRRPGGRRRGRDPVHLGHHRRAQGRACTRPTRSGRRPGPSPRSSGFAADDVALSWPRRWPTRPASSSASSLPLCQRHEGRLPGRLGRRRLLPAGRRRAGHVHRRRHAVPDGRRGRLRSAGAGGLPVAAQVLVRRRADPAAPGGGRPRGDRPRSWSPSGA